MKKTVQKLLCAGMALAMLLALAACGDSGSGGASVDVTEVGTYKYSKLTLAPFESAALMNVVFNSITLYSDNTFTLTNIADTHATSDFESIHRSAIIDVVAYGTYEILETSEELNESTIKITSVTRIINGTTDTNTDELSDENRAWMLTNNGAVGTEIIVSNEDHSMTEISILSFRIGPNPDPQQEAMAQAFWGVN